MQLAFGLFEALVIRRVNDKDKCKLAIEVILPKMTEFTLASRLKNQEFERVLPHIIHVEGVSRGRLILKILLVSQGSQNCGLS